MVKLEECETSRLRKVWHNLHIELAVLGLIASSILGLWLWLSVGQYIEMAVFVFLACATYLLIAKRRSAVSITFGVCPPKKPSAYFVLSISFFLLFSYSVMAVALRPELYSRPLEYFIVVALMAAVVTAQIFTLPKKKSYTYLLLLQIILLGLSLRFTPQFIFPGVLGNDPWAHQWFTTQIIEGGHIPSGFGYSYMPVMHLIVGSTSFVTGLEYASSNMLSVSLIQVIGFVMFGFLLGRILGYPKAGLLGALVLMLVPELLSGGIFGVTPNGFALLWIIVITYLLFMKKGRRSITLVCLLFLFMGLLILTHPMASLAMAILLFCFWIGFMIYRRAQRESFVTPVGFYLSLLFTVGMLGFWMYVSGHIDIFAEYLRYGFIFEEGTPPDMKISWELDIPYSEYLLNLLGFMLFYAFAIIGLLHMLSPGARHKRGFALVLGGCVLIAIAFFSQSTGLIGMHPHRWFYTSQLIMAVPAAVGLISVSRLFQNSSISSVVLAILIFTMSFFMISNAMTNRDNPIYSENLAARTAFTASELQGMNTISDISKGSVEAVYSIFPDVYYFMFNREQYAMELTPYLWSQDFGDLERALVIIREEIVDHPIYTSAGIINLDYDPRQALEEQGFSRIYDCGSVTAFLSSR